VLQANNKETYCFQYASCRLVAMVVFAQQPSNHSAS